MIEQEITLLTNGRISFQKCGNGLQFGYSKNRGVYSIKVKTSGEWNGLTIRAFWHIPDIKEPITSLLVDNVIRVPALVTSYKGEGRIVFEGSDGAKTVTSADVRYYVNKNSGTCDGTIPEPGTPAWQELVGTVKKYSDTAVEAKESAKKSADKAKASEGASKKNADDSAATLQELKDGIASGNFKGEKGDKGDPGPAGKDAPQIDDTTVNDSAPWSSKHLVDMLCPPLDETGNPVVCYPVADYPLGVTASWKPTQEGSGDPSPDNVRPIKGRNSVTVERCGENLLNINPFNKFTKNGITYEYVPNGGIHISGTATTSVDSQTFPVWHLPPGKYYGLDTGEGVAASFVVQRNGKYLWLNAKGIFEILAGDVAKYWYAIAASGATLDKTVYPYIVPGSTPPTVYAPYIGQTATLTLPSTIYGGTVDAVTGEGQETWQAKSFNGTENWALYDDGSSAKFFYTADYTVDSEPLDTICSHFRKAAFTRGTIIRVYTSVFTDLDAYKDYLTAQYAAGTPVQIAYKLATPTPFTATGAQPIPALSGVNTVITDADSVTVTGRADPIKRITDLEDAVASMTNT